MNKLKCKKSAVLVLMLLSLICIVKAQTFDDSPSKEWYYEYEKNEIWASYYYFQHLVTDGDTVILGKQCFIIKEAEDYNANFYPPSFFCEDMGKEKFFLYREPDRLLWYNEEISDFTILHDYSAQAGDSWTIQVDSCSFDVIVDSTDVTFFDGKSHRVLYVHDSVYGTSYFPFYGGCIIEDIGHMSHFFPIEIYWRCKEIACCRFQNPLGLRCYFEDGELLFHKGKVACDSVYSVLHIGINEFNDSNRFIIYPNPTNETLCVNPNEELLRNNIKYQIYDSRGILCDFGSFNHSDCISVSFLPPGHYLLVLSDSISNNTFLKFIKY